MAKAPIDLGRVVATAIDTTLNDERSRRPRRPGVRTLATGAVLLAAVRVGQKGLPSGSLKLMKLGAKTLGDLREVREVVRDRLTERDGEHEEPYDEEPYDEEGYDEEGGQEDEDDGDADPEEDEPRGGQSDELEPDDEPEEDWEDEPEEDPTAAEDADEDEDEGDEEEAEDERRGVPTGVGSGGSPRQETPDLLRSLGGSRRRPPVMRNGSGELDPASQPPEPEPAKDKSNGRAR